MATAIFLSPTKQSPCLLTHTFRNQETCHYIRAQSTQENSPRRRTISLGGMASRFACLGAISIARFHFAQARFQSPASI
jgi:hypothetical protein